jgi:hypothetical protein
MTHDDRKSLAQMLVVLGSTFNEPFDDFKLEGYFAALKDLPIDEVRRAGSEALQLDTFFPRPARIREIIGGSANEQAEAAWTTLMQQMRWEGYTGKPELPEPIWEVVRELWGSWVTLCQTLPAEGPELLGWAKRFKSSYGSAQRVADRLNLPLFQPAKELSE